MIATYTNRVLGVRVQVVYRVFCPCNEDDVDGHSSRAAKWLERCTDIAAAVCADHVWQRDSLSLSVIPARQSRVSQQAQSGHAKQGQDVRQETDGAGQASSPNDRGNDSTHYCGRNQAPAGLPTGAKRRCDQSVGASNSARERATAADDRASGDTLIAHDAGAGSVVIGGTTNFGDNVEDEWLIAATMLRITAELPGTVATVRDSDGEFLLIEAADVLPEWVNPLTVVNRVFLSAGTVHIIPPPSSPADIGVYV